MFFTLIAIVLALAIAAMVAFSRIAGADVGGLF